MSWIGIFNVGNLLYGDIFGYSYDFETYTAFIFLELPWV